MEVLEVKTFTSFLPLVRTEEKDLAFLFHVQCMVH